MRTVQAKIISNKEVSGGFYHMRLESSYLALASRPGQFIEVRCNRQTDPLLRRPLGVHRITADGIDILYHVIGKGTTLLARKRAGEELDVLGPLGNGFTLQAAAIIVAGGIGAAPMVALAEALSGLLSKRPRAKREKTIVVIGARTKTHIVCEKEFIACGCDVRIATEDGSRGVKGFATTVLEDALRRLKKVPQATIYACGPTAMLRAVAVLAKRYGIACQVSLEERMACGVGVCLGCAVKMRNGEYKMVCKDGPVFNAEEIAW